MNLKIKKLHLNAVTPKYAHDTDACFDLVAVDKIYDPNNGVIEYRTGLAFEIPEGHVGLLFPRSSIYKTPHILSNSVGVVDSAYRGEVKFMHRVVNGHPGQYEVGDRVGQMMILPYPKVEFEEVETLTETERGDGGFGSSGR